MTKAEKIAALEFSIELLQKRIQKLKDEDVVANGPIDEPCEEGKIRNAQGQCVDDI